LIQPGGPDAKDAPREGRPLRAPGCVPDASSIATYCANAAHHLRALDGAALAKPEVEPRAGNPRARAVTDVPDRCMRLLATPPQDGHEHATRDRRLSPEPEASDSLEPRWARFHTQPRRAPPHRRNNRHRGHPRDCGALSKSVHCRPALREINEVLLIRLGGSAAKDAHIKFRPLRAPGCVPDASSIATYCANAGLSCEAAL
jgi:hypothetical protein